MDHLPNYEGDWGGLEWGGGHARPSPGNVRAQRACEKSVGVGGLAKFVRGSLKIASPLPREMFARAARVKMFWGRPFPPLSPPVRPHLPTPTHAPLPLFPPPCVNPSHLPVPLPPKRFPMRIR